MPGAGVEGNENSNDSDPSKVQAIIHTAPDMLAPAAAVGGITLINEAALLTICECRECCSCDETLDLLGDLDAVLSCQVCPAAEALEGVHQQILQSCYLWSLAADTNSCAALVVLCLLTLQNVAAKLQM